MNTSTTERAACRAVSYRGERGQVKCSHPPTMAAACLAFDGTLGSPDHCPRPPDDHRSNDASVFPLLGNTALKVPGINQDNYQPGVRPSSVTALHTTMGMGGAASSSRVSCPFGRDHDSHITVCCSGSCTEAGTEMDKLCDVLAEKSGDTSTRMADESSMLSANANAHVAKFRLTIGTGILEHALKTPEDARKKDAHLAIPAA